MKPFCLEVQGPMACFTRPEMKVERVSYDLITPSAARAVFESILWKPGIRWKVERIDVLNPVRWISVRRNEVGAVVSTRNVEQAMKGGSLDLGLNIEEERQQRAALLLRDVSYRIYADLEMVSEEARQNPGKYLAMFERRARSGQCVNQPYLGCREFAARFRLVEVASDDTGRYGPDAGEPPALRGWSMDLGWMLYDLDFSDARRPEPRFFRAVVKDGVLDLGAVEVRG